MAQYTERLWTQTKDTEQLTFIAGVNLPYLELVKETAPNSNVMIIASSMSEAVGYVLSPKGALTGQKVDIQMLSKGGGGSSSGSVLTTNSIIGDGQLGTEIQLVNDQSSPGASEYYGTDAGGAKGFFPLPSGGSGVNSVTAGTNVKNTGTASDPIINACTEALLFEGVITDNITADVNNWNPAGLLTASKIIITGPGNFKITGLQGGSSGRFIILQNNSSGPIILSPADVSSLPQNWFLSEGNVPLVIDNNGTAFLSYEGGIVQKWYVLNRDVKVRRLTLTDAQSYQTFLGGAIEGQIYEITDPPAPFLDFYTFGVKDPNTGLLHLSTTGYGYINTPAGQMYATGSFDDTYTSLVEIYIPQLNIKSRITAGTTFNCISELVNLGNVTITNCVFDDCNLNFNANFTMITDCNFTNTDININDPDCILQSVNVVTGNRSGVNTSLDLTSCQILNCTIASGEFNILGLIQNCYFGEGSIIRTAQGCSITGSSFQALNDVRLDPDSSISFSNLSTSSKLQTGNESATIEHLTLENAADVTTGVGVGSVYQKNTISNCIFNGPQNMSQSYINNHKNNCDASAVNVIQNFYLDWWQTSIIFPAFDIMDKTISLDGSTYEYTLDITGLTTIDISALGYEWVGVWNLTSTNATEFISNIITTYLESLISYKFKPVTSGLTVRFVTTTSALATSNEILLQGGANIDVKCQACNGATISDYIILEVNNQVNRYVDVSLLP